jgi:hypothetical protein
LGSIRRVSGGFDGSFALAEAHGVEGEVEFKPRFFA